MLLRVAGELEDRGIRLLVDHLSVVDLATSLRAAPSTRINVKIMQVIKLFFCVVLLVMLRHQLSYRTFFPRALEADDSDHSFVIPATFRTISLRDSISYWLVMAMVSILGDPPP